MSDEAERWKEKYLHSIEQQDKLEKRWNTRLDLLRRGLVRSSLAAEGADKAVDQCMKEMREVVRKDDMDAGLAALIPQLEKAVLDSEQRREERIGQMGAALTSLVTQLQSLPLPREVAKPLKRFAKTLEERVNQARELPLLLSELSGLQGQALSQIEHPGEASRQGLFQRLFGSREPVAGEPEAPPAPGQAVEAPVPSIVMPPEPEPVAVAVTDEPQPSVASTPVESDPVIVEAQAPAIEPVPSDEPVSVEPEPVEVTDEPAVTSEEQVVEIAEKEGLEDDVTQGTREEDNDADEDDVEGEGNDSDSDSDNEEDGTYSLPSSPEPSYSSVAEHIESTLIGLLDDLTLPEHHRPQAEAMRVRLENGLNWYELLPILDDLAVLMLAITDSGHDEFERYLKQLNERLESFQANLRAASDDHAGQQTASREMSDQLREHVGDLQSSVQEAADLDSLKRVLESRLEGLLGTMDEHQRKRDEREQEVASRLQALSGRVATMEQEATGFRAHLEEQRQKALIDTLTGLPNRAAWNERLEHEIDHLQKRRSSLQLGILDLDHFKRINDGFGHLAGDKVLKIVATQLRKSLRASDFIARFGGEEFVVLLPDIQLSDGIALLERLRRTVEQSPFHFKGEPVTITVSMGITTFRPGERSDIVLKRADQALYRAKAEGRNRIEQG